jgi:hypothetical protein
MIGQDGETAGYCMQFPGVHLNCKVKGVDREVWRRFRCVADNVTADGITQAYQATLSVKTPKNMAWCYKSR